jgi:MFS family permease
MRGRVSNTVIMAATGLAALAPLTAGLLVQHFSGRWAMAAFAIAITAAAISSIILPGFRDTGPKPTLKPAPSPATQD